MVGGRGAGAPAGPPLGATLAALGDAEPRATWPRGGGAASARSGAAMRAKAPSGERTKLGVPRVGTAAPVAAVVAATVGGETPAVGQRSSAPVLVIGLPKGRRRVTTVARGETPHGAATVAGGSSAVRVMGAAPCRRGTTYRPRPNHPEGQCDLNYVVNSCLHISSQIEY